MMGKKMEGAVIGQLIDYSLSPLIFRFLSERLEKKISYQAIHLPSEQLGEFLSGIKSGDFFGCNVTVPYKEKVLPLMDFLSPEAKEIGAVNVVHCQDGKMMGHNTDCFGFTQSVLEQELQLEDQKVLLIGVGGAARAIAYSLAGFSVRQVNIVNRTGEKAESLCQSMRVLFPQTEWIPSLQEEKFHLCINATPVATSVEIRKIFGEKDCKNLMARTACVFDLVYAPRTTCFLECARKYGVKAIDGLDMLIWQALASWEIWFGQLENQKEVKTALKEHLLTR